MYDRENIRVLSKDKVWLTFFVRNTVSSLYEAYWRRIDTADTIRYTLAKRDVMRQINSFFEIYGDSMKANITGSGKRVGRHKCKNDTYLVCGTGKTNNAATLQMTIPSEMCRE